MSDRLAISASFSVLMMSIYVLFGSDAARIHFGPEQFASHHAASVGDPTQIAAGALVPQR